MFDEGGYGPDAADCRSARALREGGEEALWLFVWFGEVAYFHSGESVVSVNMLIIHRRDRIGHEHERTRWRFEAVRGQSRFEFVSQPYALHFTSRVRPFWGRTDNRLNAENIFNRVLVSSVMILV